MFYWFSPVFLEGESKFIQTQSRRDTEVFLFTNTKCAKETEVFRISCFRHLEKPIKTKEHKIKHLFLYVFIGFPLFF